MTDETDAGTLESRIMRRTYRIVLGLTLASALTFTGCGPGGNGLQAENTPRQIEEEGKEEKKEKEGMKDGYSGGSGPFYVPPACPPSQHYSPDPNSPSHASTPSTPHGSTPTQRGGFHAPHVSTGG